MSHLSASRLLVTLLTLGTVLSVSCAMSSSSSTSPSAVEVPALAQIGPLSGPVGTAVTISGSGFAAKENTVKFGIGYIKNLESADGTTIRFVVPDGLDLCAPDAAGPCAGANPRTRAGEYAVSVITQKETSNSITFTVTQ